MSLNFLNNRESAIRSNCCVDNDSKLRLIIVLGVVTRTARRSKRGKGENEDGAVEPLESPSPRYAAINGLVPIRDRKKLQFLSRRTRVPQSEYLREAIRDLLRKYRDAFDGSPFEDDLDPL